MCLLVLGTVRGRIRLIISWNTQGLQPESVKRSYEYEMRDSSATEQR